MFCTKGYYSTNTAEIAKAAGEEIMAMTHSDESVARIFHDFELKTTNQITDLLLKNNFNSKNLKEKVHISIGIIDNLCHEIVYHKHENIDYNSIIDIVIKTIINLLN